MALDFSHTMDDETYVGSLETGMHHSSEDEDFYDTAEPADEFQDSNPHSNRNEPDNGEGSTKQSPDESDNANGPLNDELQEGMLPRDLQRKTAFYDYASEKQMSHQEAKQIYQRLQQDSQSGRGDNSSMEAISPILRAKTFAGDGRFGGADSIKSRRSNVSLPNHGQAAGMRLGPQLNETQARPSIVSQTPVTGPFRGKKEDDPYLLADAAAREHRLHQGLPHEEKPPILASEGIHGAGAGVGIGSGGGGFATSDDHVTAELNNIYTNIQQIIDIRHKYMRLSLQGAGDNPKDDPSWLIYPPPPEPTWDQHKSNGMSSVPSSTGLNEKSMPGTPIKKPRKPGQDIGEDFDINDMYPLPDASEMTFKVDESSVFQVYENHQSAEHGTPIVHIPTIREYYMDLDMILNHSSDGPSKSFAFRRLQYLEGKFNLYYLLNEYQEMADSKKVPHRDFYNVRKVDTHVHHSACMNQKHLLRFIKSKIKKCPDEKVLYRDGKVLTLQEVFDSINLSAYDLSIDTLDMHAHTDSFHRFDKFNLKYNPIGESRLRTIFLKTDNDIKGRYLAEITKEVISDLEASKYQMVEWRISIYGRTLDEWDKLAAWVVDNKLFSPNVRWLVQIPRLYDVYKSTGLVDNFEQIVINIFQPLFEVTKDPSSHPNLHVFLQRVIGFDSVDDESKAERRLYRKFPLPKEWNTKQNPPYSYWMYHLFSNIASVNVWRKQRGFNTFVLRPHCGEAGDTDHLAVALICCHSISHGLLLRKVPLLQYIFYLEQIGIAMSPLSNNALFLAYERNPFLQYFRRGLNVSLSTDDPLQFAFTKEPLIEEYAVAAQIYKLSAVDMSELAKHSVVQSGFEHTIKQRWIGQNYHLPGVTGNDMAKVNVPDIREAFRDETLRQELAMIERYTTVPATPLVSVPQAPNNYPTQPSGSPSASMRTQPSSTNPNQSEAVSSVHLSVLPSAMLPPRFPTGYSEKTPSASTAVPGDTHPQSPSALTPDPSNLQPNLNQDTSSPSTNLPFRTSEVAASAGQAGAGTGSVPFPSPEYVTPPGPVLDGSEPRMFPGVVSGRRRRSSLRRSSLGGNEGGDKGSGNGGASG
ncbi:AMP deaminase [Eremomyces bilateralis CBS 781.70]|uniref:AMP deaminase n=1 Tax=Eremomyces bilateralis CBS 781.70 TaxID=1392243 RepID=A0A6G1FXC1_9PEZI|nr:AMP deaminase [Eremomyces bilateralis CBS 781.70]KAF1810545.1 AMP deaminase [Eremomyces bilateralis CBS 781.70]